jgi:hypothetical protein
MDFRDLGEASHRSPAPLAREREIPERCSDAQRWLRAAGSGHPSKAWSRRWFQGKGVVLTGLSRLGCGRVVPLSGRRLWWREVRTGRVVARDCRRRRSFAAVRVPSQPRLFLRMVASEASPGVRSSHRSRPGGAQRSWNDVRRCRAALAAVPSSPWPPREADQYTAAAGEFVDSLESPRFASVRRKCRSATTGIGAGSPTRDLVPVPWCWKASFRLNHERLSISSERAFAILIPRMRRRAFFVPVVLVLAGVVPTEPDVGTG